MTGASLLAELRAPDAHPTKRRLVQIADAIFPDLDARESWYVLGLLGQIDDVLRGPENGAPWISSKERERIEKANQEIEELGS